MYDLDGDGNNDFYFWVGEKDKTVKATLSGELNKDFFLSETDKGYLLPHAAIQSQFSFDPGRDYYYPIPTDDRTLNPNLKQNPGWADGLDF